MFLVVNLNVRPTQFHADMYFLCGAEAETHSTADDSLHFLPVVGCGKSPPGWAYIRQFRYNNCLENSFECVFIESMSS